MDIQILTLVFTGVVTLATVIYVYETRKLVRETEKMRKNQVEPHIIAYLDLSETNAKIAYIKTKNIGQGVALNVRFHIIKELNYHSSRKLSDYPYFKDGVKYFPPNHLDKHLLVSFDSTDESQTDDSVIFEVEYETILNEKRKNKYDLNLKELIGKGNLRPPDNHLGNIGYRLENIQKLLEKYIELKQKG